jgi:cell fate regulator YaaT (PSP1 superfamily)
VYEVQFKGRRRGFYQNASGIDLIVGDSVIVEAERGYDLGSVSLKGELVRLRLKSAEDLKKGGRFPRIVRVASENELDDWHRNRSREMEAQTVAREAVKRLNLPMKVSDVDWQLDRKRVTFYFTAEKRVDFRELVRELARTFKTRVELRQIGVRDEAGRLGGVGSCGRELCCATWLHEFKPVTTQSAKVQDLPLNPTRLSGQCGRLKCCLNYELEQYMAALAQFPKVGKRIKTLRGWARVRKVDIFALCVLVEYDNGDTEMVGLDDLESGDRRAT